MAKIEDVLKKFEGFLLQFKEEKPEETPSEAPVELAEEEETPATEEAPVEEAPAEEEETEKGDADKTIGEIVATDKNGYHTIEVMVEDGKIVSATLYESSYKELKMAAHTEFDGLITELKTEYEAKLGEQKSEFEIKLAELNKKAGDKKVVQAPVSESEPQKLSKRDLIKQRILN